MDQPKSAVDVEHLRTVGTMLGAGYLVSDASGVVLQAADVITAQAAEIEALRGQLNGETND